MGPRYSVFGLGIIALAIIIFIANFWGLVVIPALGQIGNNVLYCILALAIFLAVAIRGPGR